MCQYKEATAAAANAGADNTEACWFVYLIRNRHGQLYCGATSHVIRRFREHSASGVRAARALKGKGPLQLEWSIETANKSAALALEYRIKRLTRARKEALIQGQRLS